MWESGLRASDADREQVAEQLRMAAAEGRLSPEELDQRLGDAFRARTYGELASLLADLPGPGMMLARPASPASLLSTVKLAVVLAVLLPIAVPLFVGIVAASILIGHSVIVGLLPVWLLCLAVWMAVRHRRRGYHFDSRHASPGGPPHVGAARGRGRSGFWT